MSVPAFLRRIFGGLGGADRSVHELAVLCDALLGEKGEYASTAIARDALDGGQLIRQHRLRVMEQPPDQGRLAIVDRPSRRETQQGAVSQPSGIRQ